MTDHTDATDRASPGAAAARAVPDPANVRNHVQLSEDPRDRRPISGD